MGPSNGVTVDITAQIVGYQDSIKQLQRELAKVNPGSEIGKKLRKEIDSATKELQGLEKNTKVKVVNDSQVDAIVGKVNHLGESIQQVSYLMQQVTSQDLNFSAFSEGIDSFRKSISSLQEELSGKLSSGIQETIANSAELKNVFENILSVKVDEASPAQLFDALAEGAERAAEQVKSASNTIDSVERKIQNKQRELNKRETGQFKDADARDQLIKEVNDLKQSYDDIFDPIREKMTESLKNKLGENSSVNWKEILDSFFSGLNPDNIKDKINSLFDSLKNAGVYSKKAEFYSELFGGGRNINEVVSNIDLGDPEPIIAKLKELTERIASEIGGKNKAAVLELLDKKQVDEAADKTVDVIGKAYDKVQTEIQTRKDQITDLLAEKTAAEGQKTAAESANTAIKTAEEDLRNRMSEILNENKDLQQRINTLEQQMQQMLDNKAGEINQTAGNVNIDTKGWIIGRDAVENYKKSVSDVHAKEQLIGRLKGVAERWFSIYAAVRFVEKAIRSVIATIKELDATITEIAIVTNMTQEDLWNQMQSYTAMAKEYAASISGVYKVSQLYYQQGLQTKEVMELTEQTLKMARISGLDYAEATDYMTNAVRSFKMEMDDAQRVVDVYSAIAAKSATNVAELANAMSKTASSAQAVGSSFENTTAMMAVMIETTRESSQNIGSALKSIISRYGELKENPASLVDSEGEELNLNKVDKALKSVGITLQDTNGQFRDFDEVIMELSEKWDTIDTNTQRYIATIMAGNRQQSRFLALVSSYDRLSELAEEAANSQDAAQLQFLKTLDSIDAKITQLKTSLQSLYVDSGLEEFIKGILDVGNNIITTYAQMPKIFNLPLAAIAKFALAFLNIAKVVRTVVSLASKLVVSGTKTAQGNMTNTAKQGSEARKAIARSEADEQIAQINRVVEHQKQAEAARTAAASQGAQSREAVDVGGKTYIRNRRSGRTSGQEKTGALSKGGGGWTAVSIISSLAGAIAGGITANIDEKTQYNRNLKGSLGIGASAFQGIGLGAIAGPAGAIVGGLLGTVVGIVQNLGVFFETTKEKVENLSSSLQDSTNNTLKSKNELKTLLDYKNKYEELSIARYKDAESQEAWISLNNEIATQYPELIAGMDAEGNYLVNLTAGYEALRDAKLSAYSSDLQQKTIDELNAYTDLDYIVRKILQNSSFDGQSALGTKDSKEFEYIKSLIEGTSQSQRAQDLLPQVTSKLLQSGQYSILWDNHLKRINSEYNPEESTLAGIASKSSQEIGEFFNIISAIYENAFEIIQETNGQIDNNTLISRLKEQSVDFSGSLEETYLEIVDVLNFDAIKMLKDYTSASSLSKRYKANTIRNFSFSYAQAYNDALEREQNNISLALFSTYWTKPFEDYVEKNKENKFDTETAFKDWKVGDQWNKYWEKNSAMFVQSLLDNFTLLSDEANDVYNNATKYNATTYTETLEGLGVKAKDALALQNLWIENYGKSFDNFVIGLKQIFGENNGAELGNLLGLEQIQQLNKQIQDMEGQNKKQDITGILGGLYKTFGEIEDAETRFAAFGVLESADLSSAVGLFNLAEALLNIEGLFGEGGLDSNQILSSLIGQNGLLNLINRNVLVEIDSFTKTAVDNMEDFDKALSKATKGMDISDALKMAQQMDVSINDFRLEGGKYFFDNPEIIKNTYLRYNQSLIDTINKWYEEESKKAEGDEKKKAELKQSYDELNAVINQATDYAVNSALISNGRIYDALVQIFKGSEKDVSKIYSSIMANNYAELAPDELEKIGQYTEELQKSVQNISKNTFDKAISAIKSETSQIITASSGQERLILAALGGQQIQGTINQFVLDSTKIKIDDVAQMVSSDLYLSTDQRESLLKELHQMKYENNISDAITKVVGSYESFSYDIAMSLAKAFGTTVEAMEDIVLDEITGNYSIAPDKLRTLLVGQFAGGQLNQKTYNELIAKIDKQEREQSLSNVIQTIVKERTSLSEDNLESLANTLKVPYDIVKGYVSKNKDGTFTIGLDKLNKIIQSGGKEVQEATEDLINKEIESLMESALGIVSGQTKGYTKISDIDKFKQNLENIGLDTSKYDFIGDTADALFSWNDELHAYTLTQKGIAIQVMAARHVLLEGAERDSDVFQAYEKLITDLKRQAAENIDVKKYVESAKDNKASKELEQAITNYNNILMGFADYNNLLDFNAIQAALNEGGIKAVSVANQIAELQGKALEADEITSIFRSRVQLFVDSIDKINAIGTIVSKNIVDAVGETISFKEIGNGQYIIESINNLAEAYEKLYESMRDTNAATLSELNRAAAKVLTAKSNQNVIDLISSAASMTYDALGEIFAQYGKVLDPNTIAKEYGELIEDIGGGNVRITSIKTFMKLLKVEFDETSEEFLSAYKSYNDSLIEANRSKEKQIASEIKEIANAKPGDVINATYLNKEINDELREKLLAYGANFIDGILSLSNTANIQGIITEILNAEEIKGNLLAEELAELQDALISVIQNTANLLAKGVSGTLNNTEKFSLEQYARNAGIQQLDFTKTAEGFKITEESALNLYNKIRQIDEVSSKLVLDEFRKQLEQTGESCETIVQTMQSIKELEKQIENDSEGTNKVLKNRLELYKEIAQQQMMDPEQYNFMNKSLPNAFKGPTNFWDSVTKMTETINASAKSGYMGVQDFYNIVETLGSLASESNTIEMYGYTLDGSMEKTSELLRAGFEAITGVEGSGAQISLEKFGLDFKTGVAGMADNIDDGLKQFAQSQVDILDAQIAFLEGVVAMESLDLSNAEAGSVEFAENYSNFVDNLLKQSEMNPDLKKALTGIKIGTQTFEEFLKDFDKEKGLTENYINKLKIFKQLLSYQDWDFQDFEGSLRAALSGLGDLQTELTIGNRTYLVSGDIFLEQSQDGHYYYEGKQFNTADEAFAAFEYGWANNSQITDIFKNEDRNSYVLTYKVAEGVEFNIEYDIESQQYSFTVGEKKFEFGNYKEAVEYALFEKFKDETDGLDETFDSEDFKAWKINNGYTVKVNNIPIKLKLGDAKEALKMEEDDTLKKELTDAIQTFNKTEIARILNSLDENLALDESTITLGMVEQIAGEFGIDLQNIAVSLNAATVVADENTQTLIDAMKSDKTISIDIELNTSDSDKKTIIKSAEDMAADMEKAAELQGEPFKPVTFEALLSKEITKLETQKEELIALIESKEAELSTLNTDISNIIADIETQQEILKDVQAQVIAAQEQKAVADKQKEDAETAAENAKAQAAEAQRLADEAIAKAESIATAALADAEAQLEKIRADTKAIETMATRNSIKSAVLQLTPDEIQKQKENLSGQIFIENENERSTLWKMINQIVKDIKNNAYNPNDYFGIQLKDLYDEDGEIAYKKLIENLTTKLSELFEENNKTKNANVEANNVTIQNNAEGTSGLNEVGLGEASSENVEKLVVLAKKSDQLSADMSSLAEQVGKFGADSTQASNALARVISTANGLAVSISDVMAALARLAEMPIQNGITSAKGNVALAKGTQTLMGELGPELYVSNGRYYVAGQAGAEFVNLPDDAIVFNHLQTKRLLNNGTTSRGTAIKGENRAIAFAKGSGPAKASAAATLASLKNIRAMWQSMLNISSKDLANKAGGGGGGDDDKQLQNVTAEIQRWYNLLRQIDKLEKDISYQEQLRAKIESDRVVNGRAMYQTYKEELKYLDQEIVRNKELASLQKSWYDRKREELANSDYGKIFTYDENGLQQYVGDSRPGSGLGLDILETLTKRDVNGQAIGAAENVKTQLDYLKSVGFNIESLKYNDDGTIIDTKKLKGDKLDEAYVQMMQNFWDNLDGWRDELDGIYDSYHEQLENVIDNEEKRNGLLQEIIDNQLSVEQSIYKAITEREQAAIDRAQDERDALSDAADKFLDGLSEQLDREQKMREKNDTDTETSKLRRQLAILQRSGGSASQIRSLENEIRNRDQDAYFQAQQDQIDAIKEASDAQLERLDHQIDIMTETLEYQKEHGLLWEEVYQIMAQTPEQIQQFIMENTPDFESNSALQVAEDLRKLKGEIELWISSRDDSDNPIYTDAGHNWSSYVEASQNRYKDILTDELLAQAKAAFDAEYVRSSDPNAAGAAADAILNKKLDEYNKAHGIGTGSSSGSSGTGSSGSGSGKYWNIMYPDGKNAGKRYGSKAEATSALNKMIANAQRNINMLIAIGDNTYDPEGFALAQAELKRLQNSKVFAYKHGGLADYTGLAMVHGSKSRPEAFFNAEQTEMWKNDILGKRNSLTSLLLDFTSALGDLADSNTYNTINRGEAINIDKAEVIMNVGSIANDYDARRAGESALEQMLSIARKTGARGVSRG